MRNLRTFIKEEDGMGTVEIVLIIVVLISLVAVFKDGKWIMAKKVVVGEDGIITATLECLGTVAIIVEEQDLLLLPEPEN